MTDLIALLAAAAVVMLLIAVGPKKERRTARLRITPPQAPCPVDDTPDRPMPFGYKSQWYAVRTTDARAVADAFGLQELAPCSWESGLRRSHELSSVFVTPPLGGWTLVVGWSLPDLSSPQEEAGSVTSLLRELSRTFGEAHYYATHRVVEYHAWAKAAGGELVRAYGYVGESDEVLLDVGERTPEERTLGLMFAEPAEPSDRGEGGGRPAEEDVLVAAGAWSVNPMLPPDVPASMGWTGGLPGRRA
ncbi:hypothetical protein [Paenibacillus mucilaginosus]|uniref:hypothetical protein n=1 Tax=Paenibacillus mucilaginosus TaxID=61624 RepID=UPI001F16F513|nr:hypothetical protein [Paenibacillus mucilaginosus]MCG7214532.1 hypothetical protein [Paenibacillus mucilaginosus]